MSPAELKQFLNQKDAFGGSALDDARREGHGECQDELEKSKWNEEVKLEMFSEVETHYKEVGF
jgi:hypothetical protein